MKGYKMFFYDESDLAVIDKYIEFFLEDEDTIKKYPMPESNESRGWEIYRTLMDIRDVVRKESNAIQVC